MSMSSVHSPDLDFNLEDPEESLESTTDEALAALEASDSNDMKLGLACLNAAQRLASGEPERAIGFALRALKIFEALDAGGGGGGESSLSLARALTLVGSISCKLKRFDDSLDSLNTADQILRRMEHEGRSSSSSSSDSNDIVPLRTSVHALLANTKTAMGRKREALLDLQTSLELKTLALTPDCAELGAAYKDMAEAYTAVLDFDKALPLCLKALDIHKAQLGQDSLEVARIRRLLALVYIGLGENEQAMEQNELSRRTLEFLGSEDERIDAEIEAANIQIALERLDEAIDTLKEVIQRTGKDSEAKAFVLVSMAKALCSQEKFGDSRRCLDMSCRILDKVESYSPVKVAEAFAEISMLYETMNEFESAISLMKRTIAMLEKLPQERYLEGSISARIGWLLLLTGRTPQAVPYLERAVEGLKANFSPKHFGIGFVYKHLGQAYLEMDQLQLATQMLLLAKEINYDSLGPHHEDSIDTCQCLANSYGAMGSYALAAEFQQQVVDAWESHGPNAIDEFREAHRLLEQLKKKAMGSPSAVYPAHTLPLSLPLQK